MQMGYQLMHSGEEHTGLRRRKEENRSRTRAAEGPSSDKRKQRSRELRDCGRLSDGSSEERKDEGLWRDD